MALLPGVTYENSYRLPEAQFPVSIVKAEADKVLKDKFDNQVYDPRATNLLLKEATDEIAKTIKKVVSPQYKYAVQVTLSEKIGQAFFSGTMCLWDPDHDNYVTTSFETGTFLVVVVIFGSLLE
jgi:hypothetical protein